MSFVLFLIAGILSAIFGTYMGWQLAKLTNEMSLMSLIVRLCISFAGAFIILFLAIWGPPPYGIPDAKIASFYAGLGTVIFMLVFFMSFLFSLPSVEDC